MKQKRKRLTEQEIKNILYYFYVEKKSNVEIEKILNISNGHISKIVRGIAYPELVNKCLLEIKKELDNQQPNLSN